MEYLVKSSIVLAVFYLCYHIVLRKETFFAQNRWYLLTGIVISVIFPLVIIPIQVTVEPQIATQQFYTYADITPITEQTADSFNWESLLIGLYITGLVVFFVQFLFQFGSLIWLLITNPKRKDQTYTYVIVNNKISPFSFFKWIVYNPESFNKTELELMLTHEKVHANQWHSIDIILTQLACSIFWFNPLVWLYRKHIRQNLEYIADYKTQEFSQSSKIYQHLLLKTSIADKHMSLSNNFYNSLIKERIVMLQKTRSNNRKKWRYLLVLPVLTVLLMSMNTETVYVSAEDFITEESINYQETKGKNIEVIFNKNTTDEQLDKIKSELNSNGVTMTIKTIKRNTNNEITSIDVDFKTKNGSANYNISSDEGISPFKFSMKDDGSFGVSSMKNKEVIIVEEIHKGDLNELHENPNVFIFKEGDNDEVIEVKEDSTGVYKIRRKKGNTFIIKETNDDNLHQDHDVDVHVVTGYRNPSNKDTLKVWAYKVDSSKVVKEIKFKTDYFFQGDDEDVDVIVDDKTVQLFSPKNIKSNKIKFYGDKDSDPLIIVNGERMSLELLQDLNPDQIDSMTVLKGDDAVSTYGKDAKDGVIIIKRKDLQSLSGKANKRTKWVTKDDVTAYGYFYDDKSKNSTLTLISKNTADNILDDNKAILEQYGVTVKYSKLRRNKAGEITSIKITLKNNKGDQSSASYKDDDGITDIEYGVIGDKLIVRSRN